MLLFFCEREWMKNRCKATVRTVVYLVYHCATQFRVDSGPPVSVLDASLKNFIRLPFLLFHF